MDLTTLANVKAYGDMQKTGMDAILPGLITAVSRQIETYCRQTFGPVTASNQVLDAQITATGALVLWPATPVITAITAGSLRGGATGWQPLDVTLLEVEARRSGAVVRDLTTDRTALRGQPTSVRLSYSGGYADLTALPAEIEFACRRLVWWAVKQREAPMEKTAVPELGVVVIPQAWPPDVYQALRPYVRALP